MTDQLIEFTPFPKIARWSRDVVITEKIDGTNASIWINEDKTILKAASRNRWITPENDNFGFAKWVEANKEQLLWLGPGYHFGEWWGLGIQRTYGMKEKVFSLFNTIRFEKNPAPPCCRVVPVLYQGPLHDFTVQQAMDRLKAHGSYAADLGFGDPEGIIIYHTSARTLFKKTFEQDEKGKEE
jgi:hypothetical protein